MEDDDLCCASCGRDYEMPRRYVIKADDVDYAPIPRLLNCLHSCCSSCCEEQYQRSGAECTVVCPVCRESQVTRNVRTIPLDGPALKHIYKYGGAEMMAYCSRCHDETESYSWCFDCQAALCEFHHKDHHLTIDTVAHRIESFGTISEQKIPIDPHLPPISCPESLVADCSAYCQTCCHLISAEAMVKSHMRHDVMLAKELYEGSRGDILVANANVLDREEEVDGAMEHLKGVVLQLDEEEEAVSVAIAEEFDKLRKVVDERERALHVRLQDVAQRKRQALSAQIEALSTALESCRSASAVATAVVDDESSDPPDAGGMYVVSAAKAIVDRCNKVNEETLSLALSPSADPMIRFTVDRREIRVVETLVQAVGALQTLDSLPSMDRAALAATASSTQPHSSGGMPTLSADAHEKYMSDAVAADPAAGGPDKKLPSAAPTPGASSAARHPGAVGTHGTHKGESTMAHMAKTANIMARNRPATPPPPPPVDIHFTIKADPSSAISDMALDSRSMETIIIEARLTPKPDSGDVADGSGSGNEGGGRTHSKPRLAGDDWSEALGVVLGQIVLKTEVDRRFFPRHEVRNLLESLTSDNLPTFRVVKEVVSVS